MKMKGLPASVRVGPFDMSLRLVHQADASAEGRWGCFKSTSQSIELQDEFPNAAKAVDTLVHEINHAIYWAYGIEDDDKEERVVATFATAWVQVYRDNPWLLMWIKRALA